MNSYSKDQRLISRRKFLGEASCAAVGSTAFLSTLLNLKLTSSLSAQATDTGSGEDYKALVCLFLAGGNDSFNMLVPRDTASYNEYQSIRTDLALAKDTLLPVTPAVNDGREYGLHPSFPEIQSLFNAGRVAFVSNVGTLVAPTTLQDYKNDAVELPLGLYSHSDQIAHWQTSQPDIRTSLGWAGRMADLLKAANSQQDVSMNISLSGNNIFQTGQSVTSFSISNEEGGQLGIEGYGEEGFFNQFKTNTINSLMDQSYNNLLQQAYTSSVKSSIDANEQVKSALASAPALTTTFPTNEIGKSFQSIAKMISVRAQLGMKRQTFFITFGGWDHHDEVINNQLAMLGVVSQAMSAFDSAMNELGLGDKVTTFTSSDFGRTLTSNGKGSDHAWGGNQMVMGGAVNGKLIYGDYPALYSGNPLDTGRGRLIPTTSVDEYFAELAIWFGVSKSDLPTLFPNLTKFYIPGANNPIGFMKA